MNIDELVVKHAAWIRKLARKYCFDEFDADDLASETIYKCLSHARQFDVERSFKPYAMAIMENTFKTLYNRRKCVQFCPYDYNDTYPYNEYADQRAAVNRIISVIRECNRNSVCIGSVILYAKGYSNEEIAEMIGVPAGTVRRRIFTGRKMLCAALEDFL